MLSVTFKPSPVFNTNFVSFLLEVINMVRRDPTSIIGNIRTYSDYPQSDIDEAISFLRIQPSVQPLSINPLLSKVAQVHVDRQSRTGEIGHGDLQSRLDVPIVSPTYTIAENISYGLSNPIDIVVAWIVDYGVPNRGHRINLFNPSVYQIGIGYGSHPVYRTMVVNDYASGFAS